MRGVIVRVSVVGRLVVVTGNVVSIFPIGIIPVLAENIVAVRMCVLFSFACLVSFTTLDPERLVTSLRSVNGNRSSGVFVFVFVFVFTSVFVSIFHCWIIVVEMEVLIMRPVHIILVVGTGVMTVFALVWRIICRKMGSGRFLVALLHIALAVRRINGKTSIASFVLVLREVAGSQGSVVEWSHALVIGRRAWRR